MNTEPPLGRFDLFAFIALAAILLLTRNPPEPGPNPPEPTPDILDEKLIDHPGYNVLVIFDEERDRHGLTPDQFNLLADLHTAGELRLWFDANLDEWEELSPYPESDPPEQIDAYWRDPLKRRPDGKFLWVVASSDKGSWEGEPENIESLLSKLKTLK